MEFNGPPFGKEEPSMDATEAELVQRVLLGDKEALSALYAQNYKAIYAYFLKRVSNKHDAEILTAETFTRAVEALRDRRYQEIGNPFKAWLFGIARNVYLEHRRKPSPPLVDEPNDNSDKTNVLDILVEQENSTDLWKLVRELEPDEQTVVDLRYSYELSYGEIAHVLNRTPAACKQLHYRALRKLREKAKSSGLWNPGK